MPIVGPSHWAPDPSDAPRLRDITVATLLDEATARRPDADALVVPSEAGATTDWRLSYAELQARARAVAKALIASGLDRGDTLMVWAPNVPEHVLLQLGAAYANVTTVPINPLYRRDDLAFVLDRARPAGIVLTPEMRGASLGRILGEARKVTACQPWAVTIGDGDAPDATGWDAWIATGTTVDDATLDARIASVTPDDLAQIQFTSGTTGFPKGVRLPHRVLANQGIQIAHRAGLDETVRFVNPMPLFHCGGCVVTALSTLAVGGAHLPIVRFDPRAICETIQRERATAVSGVPTMLIAMHEEQRRAGWDLSSLDTVFSGGSPVPEELGRGWQERLGVTFTITYGQTEFAPVATLTGPADAAARQIDSVGQPIGHAELDVVVPGTAERVPTGTEGEIRYRGYVMDGYHDDPEATAKSVTADGWLLSGDLGTIDADGYVRITGRAKEIIIRGGENIAPASVEDAVRLVAGVADVSVIGVPDERFGEELCAFVRLEPGHALTATSLREALLDRVVRYRIPRYLVVLDRLPLTPSGKVQRFRLSELYVEAQRAGTVQDSRATVG